MRIRLLWAALLTGMVCVPAPAAQPKVFSVAPDESFAIKLDGVVVAMPKDPRTDASARVVAEKNGYSVLGEGIRKEFAVFDDRLEYTFDFAMPPGPPVEMTVLLPLPEDGTATVTSGRTYTRPRDKTTIKGAELKSVKPGASYGPLQYVAIRSGTYTLSVDTFPAGANSEDASYAESPLRIFSGRPVEKGIEVVAAIYRGYSGFGSHLKGKIVFYSDGRPYEGVHPFIWANEYGALEKYIQLVFTDKKPKSRGEATPFGTEAYSPERKYGWTAGVSGLKLQTSSLNSPIHGSFITSGEPAKFRIDAPPGYYFLTLNIGNADGAAGPFRVKVDGEERLPRVELDKGRFRNESLLLKTTAPSFEVEFEGIDGAPWLLNGLVVEPLGTLNEDFTFTRPWWNFSH